MTAFHLGGRGRDGFDSRTRKKLVSSCVCLSSNCGSWRTGRFAACVHITISQAFSPLPWVLMQSSEFAVECTYATSSDFACARIPF
ncbi:hypothetical protein O181_092009 [Austropuccinia psidii MF-1]|uniref:Uncharacterized protein n=1 Tax=Austropuccinia psidii MF-1 TaxID=1389203 RepID=A0A9Q3IYN5_9BASI|nr:hypothetical protein [Austropuccinia psidii MF-1]